MIASSCMEKDPKVCTDRPVDNRNLWWKGAGTIKVKTIWTLIKQEMTRCQWHQLDHLQIICISLQTDNHASTSSLSFFTGRMLFLMPNQWCQSTKANLLHLQCRTGCPSLSALIIRLR